MAVTFRSARSTTFASATSTVLTKPTGLADNDLMIAYVLFNRSSAGSATLTPPTGWTLLDSENPRTGQYLWVYYRQVTTASTEPASYTWTFSNAGGGCAVIDTRYGEDLSTPMGAHALAAGTFSGGVSTITAPSVTTTGPQRLISTFLGTLTAATVATPAGLTSRASAISSGASFRLADFTKLDAGATGNVTTPGSGGAPFGAQVSIKPANVAPNAPTLNSPANGATVDLTAIQRLSWVFSDPDYGDTQSKFDLQYRIGTGAWTTVTTTTANQYSDFAGGTFSAATYEWQVRTYDAAGLVGPWSASSFFTAANPPAAPTITAPTSGGTVTTATATVTWTAAVQAAYQVRRVADISGSPDTTSTPLWDSGAVTATATRSLSVAFPTNNHDEHVQVRIQTGGLWSAWTDALVHIAYTPPATPTLALTADNGNPLDVFDPPRIIVAVTDPPLNVLSADDASFEATIGTWASGLNCTVARSTAQAVDGAASLAMTSAAAGDMRARTGTTTYPVTPGQTWTALVSIRAATVARSVTARISWRDGSGTQISDSIGTLAADSTTGWTSYSVTAVAPVGAVYAAASAYVTATGGAGEVHYADKAALFQTATVPAWDIGGRPAVDHLDVYRSDDGQVTWTRVATGLAPGSTWTDYTPASGVDYSYQVVAVAADGTTATSAAVGTATSVDSFGFGY